MTVGTQTNVATVNANLTQDSIDLRDLANRILQRWSYLNKLGLSGLQGLGFTAGDAQAVLDNINHMVVPAQVYKGTVQAQGTGGTGAVLFNFEDYLTPLTGGG